MRNLVVGDIHGAHKALIQCLERSQFDREKDRLIVLGDVCDVNPDVRSCIEELVQLKHCVNILGNHDQWTLEWAQSGYRDPVWVSEGGKATLRSYNEGPMPPAHINFLKNALLWWELDDRLFVHGGFDATQPIAGQDAEYLIWDRDLILNAHQENLVDPTFQFGPYREIYLGHTTTQNFHSEVPIKLCNVWAMDTGAGWAGTLTMMDIASKEFWQSDSTVKLYGKRGR